jgi:hypothetical protein
MARSPPLTEAERLERRQQVAASQQQRRAVKIEQLATQISRGRKPKPATVRCAAVSSWRYSASHPASFGRWTKPFSIIAIYACMRMTLSDCG